MGVVSRKWVWVEFMGMTSGCGCKKVYRFPHMNIPTPLVYICSFLQQHSYFLFILKRFFVLVPVLFVIYVIIFFVQYKNTYGRLWASNGSRMNGCT